MPFTGPVPFSGNVCEVRSTGNNLNGGIFNPNVFMAGNDYTQQDSAQLILTDLATTNGDNTNEFTVTSAAGLFSTDIVGNCLCIEYFAGATGWNKGRCIITGFTDVNTITVQNITSAYIIVNSSTCSLGKGRVGGALSRVSVLMGRSDGIYPDSLVQPDDKIWVKAGTISELDFAFFSTLQNYSYSVEGYSTVRGDLGAKPVLQLSSSAPSYIRTGYGSYVKNIVIDANNNSDLALEAFQGPCFFENCTIKNSSKWGLNCLTSSPAIFFVDCKFTDNGDTAHTSLSSSPVCGGVLGLNYGLSFETCSFDNNLGPGLYLGSGAVIDRCSFWSNSGNGIYCDGGTQSIVISNCVFYNNSLSEFAFVGNTSPEIVSIRNSIFHINNNYGIESKDRDFTSSNYENRYLTNGFFNNANGAVYNVNSGVGTVTLTGSPFNDPSNGDFTLNNTSGAGQACKGVGTPSYLDLGIYQSQVSSTPVTPVTPSDSTANSGVLLLTSTAVIRGVNTLEISSSAFINDPNLAYLEIICLFEASNVLSCKFEVF